jgi:hypothetical protein
VQSGHGRAGLHLPLGVLQHHVLTLLGERELVEVPPAGAAGVRI